MQARILRLAVALLAVLTIGLEATGTTRAQIKEIPLAWDMPDGVAFDTLAAAEASTFRHHADALYLHRITVDCGQVTGRIFGMEQITFVEYGQVEVRDWETGEVIETLAAGESFGPTADESAFFLASPTGRNASVYHFSAGGSGAIGDDLPKVMYETTDCGSGATNPMPAQSAAVTTLFADDRVVDSMPTGAKVTLYVGLLTVAPGASIGRPYETGEGVIRYSAGGSGVILPLFGGFGDGSAGMAGMTAGPEVGPGTTAWTYPQGDVALENFGPVPTTALMFGAVYTDQPIFIERHASR